MTTVFSGYTSTMTTANTLASTMNDLQKEQKIIDLANKLIDFETKIQNTEIKIDNLTSEFQKQKEDILHVLRSKINSFTLF